jgi:ankyrin repeat protein
MDGDRIISQSTFGHDARIIQGDVIATVEGSVSVTNNYGIPLESTREGEGDILCRLYTSPYEGRKDRNPTRVSGTCEWFTSHELFTEWERSESSRLLWVSADPGCGKSVLVKHLVDSVLSTTESRTVCYFFFKDDFKDQKNVVSALCCILRQLFMQRPLLFSDEVLRQFVIGGETFLDSFTELWKILIQVSRNQNAGEIICILDAIDECEDQGSQLSQELCKLYGAANDFHLKFLLTSRPYGGIYRGFRPLEIPELPVIHLSGESEDEVRKISQEIDIFIRSRVDDIGAQLLLIEEEQDLLLQGLTQTSNKTYLWAYLTLDLIMKDLMIDKSRIANAVSGIPKEMNEAYEKILSKSCDFEQARTILRIIVAAARPLTLEEMNLALALAALQKSHRSNDDIELKPEERFRQELRDICGLFITIFDSKIYLLHQTAREFLLDGNPHPHTDVTGGSTWKHSLSMLESHTILSDICNRYLCNLESDVNRHKRRTKDMIFLDYSANYWATHFRELHMEIQKEKTELVLKFCDINSVHGRIWFKAYWTSTNTKYPQGFTTLMLAAYFGLQTVVQYFLDNKAEINSKDDTYQRSALSWAARNGFDTTARVLIRGVRLRVPWRTGAKVNQVDKYGRTPLSYAVWNGSTAMVELLVKAGARTNLKDELGGTPMSYAYLSQNERIINILLQQKNKADDENSISDLLFSAAEKGHEEVVELVLKTSRVSPDAKSQNRQPPLLCAAKNGHVAVVKVLLERGADPNYKDSHHQTPLRFAIQEGHAEILKALLERGADLNDIMDRHQPWAPLMWAVEGGHEEVVRFLVEKGANPNSKDDVGQTPLLYATARDDVVMVKALVEKGADINDKNDAGHTPLSYAIERVHEEMVKALLEKGADPNSKDERGRTPLLDAAAAGNVAIAEALLNKGADLNHKDDTGETPLSCAIETGQAEIVSFLLGKGADLSCENASGLTPLSHVAAYGKVANLGMLLQHGVDLNYASSSGRTPLSHAAENNQLNAMETLLERGADPTYEDKLGRAPLSYAAEGGHVAVLKILINRGANPDQEDVYNRTPLLYAAQNGHRAVVMELLNKKANPNYKDTEYQTPLSITADIAVASIRFDRGANPNQEDIYNRTPLSYAAQNGHQAVVVKLLSKKANPNYEDTEDRTPLSYAAEGGYVAVLKTLIDRGANPNQDDIYNRTPLFYAAQNGHQAVVMKLLEKGANPNHEDLDNRTPLFWATQNGDKTVEKLLIEAGANSRPPVLHTTGKSHERAVSLLLKEGADNKKVLLWAVEKDYEAVTKELLEGLGETDLATLLLWAEEQGHEAVARVLSGRKAEIKREDEATTTIATTSVIV